jgi:hypothetical protein
MQDIQVYNKDSGGTMKLREINTAANKIKINNLSWESLNTYISDMSFYNWANGNKVPSPPYQMVLRKAGVEDI